MNTKLFRTNLLILLAYAGLTHAAGFMEPNGASILIAVLMMIAVGIHVGVLVVVAIIKFLNKEASAGGQWLLNALLIAVIGFGTCLGSAALAETWSGPANFH